MLSCVLSVRRGFNELGSFLVGYQLGAHLGFLTFAGTGQKTPGKFVPESQRANNCARVHSEFGRRLRRRRGEPAERGTE